VAYVTVRGKNKEDCVACTSVQDSSIGCVARCE
jgi:hypothetical protein